LSGYEWLGQFRPV